AMVLFAAFTLLCLEACRGDFRYMPIMGVVLGLLLLTKAYGLSALIVLLGVVLYRIKAAAPRNRLQASVFGALAFFFTGAIAAWWYLRNLRLVGSIVWVDGAPNQKMSMLEILRHIPKVDWSTASRSVMGSHIWFGNWSFLSVRSWM